MAGVSGVKGCGSPAIQAQSAPQERRRSRRWPAPCARQWCTSTLAPHPLSFYNAVRAWHPMMLLRGPWRRAAGVLAVAVALSCRAVQGQVRLPAGNPVASRSSRMASALAPKNMGEPLLACPAGAACAPPRVSPGTPCAFGTQCAAYCDSCVTAGAGKCDPGHCDFEFGLIPSGTCEPVSLPQNTGHLRLHASPASAACDHVWPA